MTPRPTPVIRSHGGRHVPTPGRYALDTAHSSVEFTACNLMVARVRGRFTFVSGSIIVDEIPERSRTCIEIAVASLTTNSPRRDGLLLGPDLFDVDRFPTIGFRSTGVASGTAGTWTVSGDLTIRGVSRRIHLDTIFDGADHTPEAGDRIGFRAHTELDRGDWGVAYDAPLEPGGALIGGRVQVEVDVRALVG